MPSSTLLSSDRTILWLHSAAPRMLPTNHCSRRPSNHHLEGDYHMVPAASCVPELAPADGAGVPPATQFTRRTVLGRAMAASAASVLPLAGSTSRAAALDLQVNPSD